MAEGSQLKRAGFFAALGLMAGFLIVRFLTASPARSTNYEIVPNQESQGSISTDRLLPVPDEQEQGCPDSVSLGTWPDPYMIKQLNNGGAILVTWSFLEQNEGITSKLVVFSEVGTSSISETTIDTAVANISIIDSNRVAILGPSIQTVWNLRSGESAPLVRNDELSSKGWFRHWLPASSQTFVGVENGDSIWLTDIDGQQSRLLDWPISDGIDLDQDRSGISLVANNRKATASYSVSSQDADEQFIAEIDLESEIFTVVFVSNNLISYVAPIDDDTLVVNYYTAGKLGVLKRQADGTFSESVALTMQSEVQSLEPFGDYALVGFADGNAQLLDPPTGELRGNPVRLHKSGLSDLSANNDMLFSVGSDGEVRRWPADVFSCQE